MKSKNIIIQLKINRIESQRKFDAEIKQRNQQHEQMILHH